MESATMKTSNGLGALGFNLACTREAVENTSNGPQKSNTSTSS
jgi:hypothetical protein